MDAEYFPYMAPLSRPLIESCAKTLLDLKIALSLDELIQEFQTQCSSLIERVKKKRDSVYALMTPAVENRSVSTDWVMTQLAELSPRNHRVSHETMSRWRDQGLLSYDGHNRPNYDSAAALMILRILDQKRIKGWTPTQKITEQEPRWWCWRQDSPTSPILPTPVPLPEDIPPTALLWTTWAGAAWEPEWFSTGELGVARWGWLSVGELGAARWAGTHLEKNRHLWSITEAELLQWDPQVTPLGKTVMDAAPLAQHTLATLSLLRLAVPRIQQSMAVSQEHGTSQK